MEVYPDEVEGGYTASFPDLPGCLTCAESMEALIENANDAKKEWLTAALEEGYIIAEPIEWQKNLITIKGEVLTSLFFV